MVRKRKSWREATIISCLDPDLWRAEYRGGGSGMFREADIRAYDAERDARPAAQSRRAKATAPQNSSRSRYAIDPETITAGRLPQRAPVVTSAANSRCGRGRFAGSGWRAAGFCAIDTAAPRRQRLRAPPRRAPAPAVPNNARSGIGAISRPHRSVSIRVEDAIRRAS